MLVRRRSEQLPCRGGTPPPRQPRRFGIDPPASTSATRLTSAHRAITFPLTRALEYVFIAGGVGITPILALIEAVERVGRPWRLIYSGRTADEMAYCGELSEQYTDHVAIQETSTAGRVDFTEALADLRAAPRSTCADHPRWSRT